MSLQPDRTSRFDSLQKHSDCKQLLAALVEFEPNSEPNSASPMSCLCLCIYFRCSRSRTVHAVLLRCIICDVSRIKI